MGHSSETEKVETFVSLRQMLLKQREKTLVESSDTASHSPAAVYGFVCFFLSFVALFAYIGWAFRLVNVPNVQPSTYWALALPTWICVSLALIPVSYRLLCIAKVPQTPSKNVSHHVVAQKDFRVPPIKFV